MVPRWLQDRSKSALGGVLGRLGRGLGPLLGVLGLSLDGLGGLLGSLDGVLGCFWELLGPLCNGLGGPLMFIVYVVFYCMDCGCLMMISVIEVY